MPPKNRRVGYKPKHLTRTKKARVLSLTRETYVSDNFFSSLFTTEESCDDISTYVTPAECTSDSHENTDSDGQSANEFFVILNKVYRYSPHENLDEFVSSVLTNVYEELYSHCKDIGNEQFFQVPCSKDIKFISLYDNDNVSLSPRVKSCIHVSEDFNLNISVHSKPLPPAHPIWSIFGRKCYTVTAIQNVIREVSKYRVCCGNPDKELVSLMMNRAQTNLGYEENVYIGPTIRSTSCSMLVNGRSERCQICKTYRKTLIKTRVRKRNMACEPTPKKNWLQNRKPNSLLSDNQKRHKIKQLSNQSLKLKKEVKKLRSAIKRRIQKEGIIVDQNLNEDFAEIMRQSSAKDLHHSDSKERSYQKLFWEQQLKLSKLKDKRGMRWHPMVIKWCIYLKSKSSTTYDSIRNSGFITLPCERTLHDYTSLVTKGTGFHPDVVTHLYEEVSSFTGHQRIVGILHDEIRIKSDLVYDKHTGKLVGFVDLGDVNNDLSKLRTELPDNKKMARYVLVLMVRGVSSNLKYPLAHFSTNGVTSDQLFNVLWEAVEILEMDVGLEVMFITSDGASPNRRFVRLHKDGDQPGVLYKAHNLFSPTLRYIYFVGDAPHLIKTTRNCFSNSHSHKNSRQMWKDGFDISWLQIVDLYKGHCSGLYKLCSKLTQEHINVSSFGAMKVRLAAQVLSSTVANALELKYDDRVQETVKFIRHMDKFFDCLNSRNVGEGFRKRNDNIKPFYSCDDPRLTYLTNDFLGFFQDWKVSVDNRPGRFTAGERNRMMLSYQTLEGLEMTTKSVVCLIRYCLSRGMEFVLTEKFNQDPIEQHFGNHRSSNGCNANPNLSEFNHSMVKLRVVGSQSLAPIRGSTIRQVQLPPVDGTPLPRKRSVL